MGDQQIFVCEECDKPLNFQKKDGSRPCYYCGHTNWNSLTRDRKKGWNPDTRHKKRTAPSKVKTREELLDIIKLIPSIRTKLRDQALISLLYLTGARIQEIVGFKDKKTNKYIAEPLKKNQIKIDDLDNVKVLKFENLPVLKRKLGKIIDVDRTEIMNIPLRTFAINYDFEYPFIEYILNYISILEDNQYLFQITPERAWQIVFNNTTLYNHYLRHVRASHLVSIFGFTDMELQQYFGWSNTLMAARYTHLDWRSISKKMIKPFLGNSIPTP